MNTLAPALIILLLVFSGDVGASIVVKCDVDTGICRKFDIDDGKRHYERREGKYGYNN